MEYKSNRFQELKLNKKMGPMENAIVDRLQIFSKNKITKKQGSSAKWNSIQ
jgi:hypothetical protein